MNSFLCDKKKLTWTRRIYRMRAHGTFWYKFETLFLVLDFSINFQFSDIGKVSFSNVRVRTGNGFLKLHTRTFLRFCTMKVARRYFKIILMVFFKKKLHLGQMWRFGPKNCIFLILHKLRSQEVHKNHTNSFKIS